MFLPPTERLEDYADLLALVEVAAAAHRHAGGARGLRAAAGPAAHPARGDPRPRRHRGQRAADAHLGRAARAHHDALRRGPAGGLATEKFDLDGPHTGTGGGNHLTLGGAEPVDSPLLRRPDLLVSLVTYWQRHPSLSYLFSGRFIGPTSQAPRFDEGRPEAVYEMEIAFAEIAG